MKKILKFFFFSLFIFTACHVTAQVNTNQPAYNGIPGENPFFDASSNFDLSLDVTSASGKGLLFPRTDLTKWQFNVGLLDGITFPTAFDGMIVFNVGTGNTSTSGSNPIISTSVTSGFYYFSNPTGSVDVISGRWIRISDQNDLKTTPTGATLPTTPAPKPGDVFYNTATKVYYYYNDTQWVPVSSTPSGPTTPAIIDSKLGDVYYVINGNPALNVLEIFNGTAWVLAGSTSDGSIIDTKLQASGGGALATGVAGQVLSSAGSNQFKWANSGSTPSGTVLPGVAPAGNTFYNTSTHTYWVSDGTTWIPAGTATSVGLSLPSFMTVTNSPVTTTGVITGTLASQPQATFFAAPSGVSGTPAFRTIQDADIPSLANKIDVSTKGAALGVAPLDASQKVPSTYLPDAILGSVTYKGIYNASTGTPALSAASSTNKGYYYVVNVVGSTPMNLGLGDWVISNGTSWEKVSNSGAVPTVFGRSGAIVATAGDYTSDLVTEGSTNKYYSDVLANMNPTLTGKEDVANKVNVIAADAGFTKYPTVDAIKNYVDAKVPSGGSNGQVLTIVSNSPAWSAGGVSSVSVTTANGVSGTVANPTTTPAITLTLGAITPASINTTGTITAATLIGNLDASKLTGSIAAARYATNTIPAAAINATGSKVAGYYLDALGSWSLPSGGSGSLPAISAPGDANKVLTVNALGNAATWVTPGSVSVPDATSTIKGVLTLSGDLSGTAASPVVQSVGGYFVDPSATPNTIVLRDGSGNMSGNATTATSATTAGTVTVAAQPAITSLGTLTNLSVVNPIVANILGNAGTATLAITATTATNVTVSDVSSGALMYPTFVNAAGDRPLDINTLKLKYAPTTGILTATTFNGNLDAAKLTGSIATAQFANITIPLGALQAGTVNTNAFLKGDGTWSIPTAGNGTVTSVGLTLPTIFTVTNSPVTTNGSLMATLNDQTSRVVLASPADGSSGTPAFRTLSGTDISDFSSKVDVSSKGAANGVVPLDASSKILASYLPSSVTGAVTYKGTFDALTGKTISDGTSLPPVGSSLGYYYVVSIAGNIPMLLNQGDWVISNGSTWDRVANGSAVSSVYGRTGTIVATNGDYTTDQVTATSTNKYYSDALVSANTTVSAKEDKSNKVNVIAADASFTKYPTVDAIKNYVDAKFPAPGGNGMVLTVVSSVPTWQTPASGSGSVTSVGLALPAMFTITNSPVTGTGTLTGALASQTQATFLAAPAVGNGVPVFRGIAVSDVPTLNQNTTGSAGSATTAGTVTAGVQTAITTVGTLTGLTVTAPINGSITGTAGVATTTAITNDITNISSVFPTWVTANSGSMPQKVSSSKLFFVPSTGVLSATSFSGNLNASNLTSGTVSTAILGSGTANSSTYLRGDGAWAAPGGSTDASTSAKGILMLANDLGGTAALPTVVSVGSQSAINIAAATVLVTAATNSISANSLVKRDASGNIFLNGSNITNGTVGVTHLGTGTVDVTTYLRGDGTWAVPPGGVDATATTKGILMLTNDLGGTATTPNVTFVGGQTAANIAAATVLVTGATSAPNPNVIVKRDASGHVLGLNATDITNGTLDPARIGVGSIPVADLKTTSGSADATTYLRGDGVWATPTGGTGTSLPSITMPGDTAKVLTVNAAGSPIWKAPKASGGGSLIAYHPSGDASYFCRASGPGVTAVLSGYNITITVPVGVWLDYFKAWTIISKLSSTTEVDITINYLGKEYNNSLDDIAMPNISVVDILTLTPQAWIVMSPYTVGNSWNNFVTGNGTLMLQYTSMGSRSKTNGFLMLLHF